MDRAAAQQESGCHTEAGTDGERQIEGVRRGKGARAGKGRRNIDFRAKQDGRFVGEKIAEDAPNAAVNAPVTMAMVGDPETSKPLAAPSTL